VKRIACLLLRAAGVFLVLVTFGLLAFMAWRFEPSEPGTSAEYWEYLCGVQLPGFNGHQEYSYFGGASPVVDGKAYYYTQMHHESLLYTVPLEDVLHDLPRVQELLANPQPPSSSSGVGHDSPGGLYRKNSGRRSETAGAMDAQKLEALRIATAKASKFPPYDEQEDSEFRGRIDRAKRVWATFTFEALYLGAWLMYVFGVRPLHAPWYWRVGSAPFLLFLPFFLGYAPMTFTFGPSGGFVYPYYLLLASLPMNIVPCSVLDGVVWQLFPNILSGLSQVPGSPVAVSSMTCVGPVSSLGFGMVLLAGVSAVIYIHRKFKRGRQAVT
jgi:hypothetical protein